MNNLTSYAYDGYDRRVQTTFPLKTQGGGASDGTDFETYAYDANSNMTSIRTRSGDTEGFTYDALNRPTGKTVPSGSGQDVFLSYDLVGRLTSATFGSPTGAGVAYTYDALSRKLTETAGGLTLASAYDAAGDRTQLTWPDGFSVGYAFDFLQRPITVTGSGVGTLASYVWDGLGDLTAIDRGNGANTSYAYDGDDRLSGLTHDFANSAADVAWSFRYDAGNGLLRRAASNDAYTSHGAAQSQGYLANGLNQYADVTTANYTYDGRGNLTSDGTRSFTYDVDNRLLTGSAPTAVTLAYDPTGRLQTSTASSATTTFLYDGSNLAAEYSGSTVLRRYVPSGLGVDTPLVWYEGAAEATPRWLHADNQGSIVAWSDAGGNNDDIMGYDPWGLPDAANGWSGSRFRYTGQITIPQADLYYYKARVYDPGLGRFLQTDPVGYTADVNLYAYVGNDPTNRADPSGDDPLLGGDDSGAEAVAILTGHPELAQAQEQQDVAQGQAIAQAAADDPVDFVSMTVQAAIPGDEEGAAVSAARLVEHEAVGPGPHAGESIPAQAGRPTAAQQREINRIGSESGCHTCGTRNPGTKSGNFIGDHQPPTKLTPPGGQQRFYPHCQGCSNVQGGRVSQLPRPSEPPPQTPPPTKP